jgi:hypothetical protein
MSEVLMNNQAASVMAALNNTQTTATPSQLLPAPDISRGFLLQFNRFARNFNAQMNNFQASSQTQFARVLNPFLRVESRFAIPGSAARANFQAAQSSVVNTLNSALSTASNGLQNAVRNVFSNVASAMSTSSVGTTGAGTSNLGTTASTGVTGVGTAPNGSPIGVTQTQIFNNAFTQAFSSFNTAIQTIGTTMRIDFAPLFAAFNTNFNGIMSTLSSAKPFSTITPIVGILPRGNGFILQNLTGSPTSTTIGTTTVPGTTTITTF